jgi:dTDP-4-dehydrorhamnose reductase
MKIVIFGSNGMLGNYLNKYLSSKYEVLALTRKDFDIGNINESKLLDFLRNTVKKDDVILNAAGIIKQRGNIDVLNMVMVNSVFPHILAKFKNEIDCKIIHITTDCVFSGLKGGYVESDKHDCLDDYGKSKSLGENENITNIRTSIIGEEITNKKSLLEWVISNKNKTVDGYENHIWNGVTCLELAKLIDEIIKNNTYWNGIKHVFSPDTVSKYELVSMINEIYNLDIIVNKKNTDIPCYRNLQTSLTPMITNSLFKQISEQKEFKL